MQENNDVNIFWLILLTLGGIFGVVNIVKAFSKPQITGAEEYESIIAEKDKIIEVLEKRITQYQKIIENDNIRRELE
ncbi:MAG TPA: hypothetical protein VHA52_04685 [Candidatus Babeliaceae bacterium]|nr:hypothetical protein [Candidatus Babeliaceae bacterium]